MNTCSVISNLIMNNWIPIILCKFFNLCCSSRFFDKNSLCVIINCNIIYNSSIFRNLRILNCKSFTLWNSRRNLFKSTWKLFLIFIIWIFSNSIENIAFFRIRTIARESLFIALFFTKEVSSSKTRSISMLAIFCKFFDCTCDICCSFNP